MELSNNLQHARAFFFVSIFCLAGPAFSALQSPPANPTATQTGQAAVTSTGSESASTKQVVPQDAKELLLAAAQVNGLDTPGLKPWHILVSYDKFDEDGDNVDNGTYEEFWAGPKRYRLSYTSHDFTQTDIANETGLFRSGDAQWPGELQTRVRDEFARPMFREMNLQYGKPGKKVRKFGKMQLTCVTLRGTGGGNMIVSDNGLAAFCFEPNSLVLRYSKGGMGSGTVWDQIEYDKIVQFQGRYIAREVQVTRGGKPYLKLRLEKLESIPQTSAADFTPPPTAVPLDLNLISPDSRVLLLDYLVYQETPQYPKSIRPPGGEAVMKYKINKDGRVTAVQFVEGNPEMQKALEGALKEFLYRPFLVMGEPVEVEVKQKFVYEVH